MRDRTQTVQGNGTDNKWGFRLKPRTNEVPSHTTQSWCPHQPNNIMRSLRKFKLTLYCVHFPSSERTKIWYLTYGASSTSLKAADIYKGFIFVGITGFGVLLYQRPHNYTRKCGYNSLYAAFRIRSRICKRLSKANVNITVSFNNKS